MPRIVLIETRAGWMVAPSKELPLTRAYHFRPGVPVDVPEADFDLLADCTLVEGRSFVPADADYAQPHIVAPAPKGDAVAVTEAPERRTYTDGEGYAWDGEGNLVGLPTVDKMHPPMTATPEAKTGKGKA